MIATVINAVAVVLGSLVGIVFKQRIRARYTDAIMQALALVVAVMGVSTALGTADTLGMIVCVAVGTLIGEWIDIEHGIEVAGDALRERVAKDGRAGTFTEGFVNASLLFCVGSMTVMGALQAGIEHDYSILLSKSVIDCIAAVSFAAALGAGVCFSALFVLAYQGLLTLLGIWAAPLLSAGVIAEVSAVGGVLLIGVAFNMLDLGKKLRVANMLPAIFLPIAYQPLASWLQRLF